jgi:hypothetical protein
MYRPQYIYTYIYNICILIYILRQRAVANRRLSLPPKLSTYVPPVQKNSTRVDSIKSSLSMYFRRLRLLNGFIDPRYDVRMCMRICVYICMYVCMYIHKHVYMYIDIYVCIYKYIHIYTYVQGLSC